MKTITKELDAKKQHVKISLQRCSFEFSRKLQQRKRRNKRLAFITIWSALDGRPIFNRTMNRRKYQKILCVLRLDNAQSRQQNWSPDKLQPIREVFESWDSYLRDFYTSGPGITMDEQLVCFRRRCPFKQYIPSKPGKYGIKICTILLLHLLLDMENASVHW